MSLLIPFYFNNARSLPHPLSLSRKEREVKSFSLREKGWDEGARLSNLVGIKKLGL